MLSVRLRVDCPIEDFCKSVFIKGVPKLLSKSSSKEIRTSRSQTLQDKTFKIGITLSSSELINWGARINKLTSTRHKDILLRVAHGDIYTKDKLFRFGLAASDTCPRCDRPETLEHKFVDCTYIKRIRLAIEPIARKILGTNQANLDKKAIALGTFTNSNIAYLTLSAEILQRISYLKDDQTYLIHPKAFVANAIKSLIKKEKDSVLKEVYCSALNETVT